jgi:hypothetical protein
VAEGVGFEPTKLSLAGFQDRYLQPLGHPSLGLNNRGKYIKDPLFVTDYSLLAKSRALT